MSALLSAAQCRSIASPRRSERTPSSPPPHPCTLHRLQNRVLFIPTSEIGVASFFRLQFHSEEIVIFSAVNGMFNSHGGQIDD